MWPVVPITGLNTVGSNAERADMADRRRYVSVQLTSRDARIVDELRDDLVNISAFVREAIREKFEGRPNHGRGQRNSQA